MYGYIFAAFMVIGAIVGLRDQTVPPAARYAKFTARLGSVILAIIIAFSTHDAVDAATLRGQNTLLAALPLIIMVIGEIVARISSERIVERSQIRMVKLSSKADKESTGV